MTQSTAIAALRRVVVLACLCLPTGLHAASAPQFILEWGSRGVGPGLFDRPVAVAVNSAGEVFVGEARLRSIQKFDSNGRYIDQCAPQPSDGDYGLCPTAIALAVGLNDRLYAGTNNPHAVIMYDRNLRRIGYWQLPAAYGIATSRSGDVFVAEAGAKSISRWTFNGGFISRWFSRDGTPEAFQFAWAVAVDKDDFVYVADYYGSKVLKFTADGVYVTSWGSLGAGPGQFVYPTNITIDATGLVYVADPYNHRVQIFTPQGLFVSEWGQRGQGPGQFDESYGLAAHETNLYVCDAGNARIQKFGQLPTPTLQSSWGALKIGYR